MGGGDGLVVRDDNTQGHSETPKAATTQELITLLTFYTSSTLLNFGEKWGLSSGNQQPDQYLCFASVRRYYSLPENYLSFLNKRRPGK